MIFLLASLFATTAMTAFSYVVAASFRKLYKEPLLLRYVLSKLQIELSDSVKSVAAWAIHYLIGFLFVGIFHFAFIQFHGSATWLMGLFFGILIGIVGIIGWEIMFGLTGKPRRTDRFGYYTQLLMAHLIFAFVTVAVYRLM